MRQTVALILAALALSACKEDTAGLPDPIDMTAGTLGFYCQMDLMNHDGPKGQIHLDGMPAPIFFSQVKEAIAYLHMPEQSHAVRVAYVQDMAGAGSWASPGEWISADAAVYVIGSDKMGGMGAPEFVPFSAETAATDFIASHGGTLRRFDEITTEEVLSTPGNDATAENPTDIARRLRALSSVDRTN